MSKKKILAILTGTATVATAIAAYEAKKKADKTTYEANLIEPIKKRKRGIYEKYIKRALDVICATGAIVVFSPVYLGVAVLVKLKLGSPVLFTQDRPGLIGKDGRETVFKMYKFRTMTDERDENGELLPDEARLTKFGKWLRNTSLDELPEAFNILNGTMSVIGPRPQLVRDMVFIGYIFLFVGIVFFSTVVLNLEPVKFFIEDILGKNVTLTNRTVIWVKVISGIIQKPFLGHGIQESSNLFYIHIDFWNRVAVDGTYSAHNQILQTLYEGGTIAIALIFSLLWHVGKEIKECSKNNEKIVFRFYGFGEDLEYLQQYQKSKGISNIEFYGAYKPEEKKKIIEETDIIFNVYGNDLHVKYAVSNKYYDALVYQKPIIVSKGTTMEKITQGFSYCVTQDKFDCEDLIQWYENLNHENIKRLCASKLNKVKDDMDIFTKRVEKFLQV